MVSWKVALVVVIIAALAMAIGMWFGYQYASEQDDISPEGWRDRSDRTDSRLDEPLVHSSSRKNNIIDCKHYSS